VPSDPTQFGDDGLEVDPTVAYGEVIRIVPKVILYVNDVSEPAAEEPQVLLWGKEGVGVGHVEEEFQGSTSHIPEERLVLPGQVHEIADDRVLDPKRDA